MSDRALGADWWQASDGRWYPPESHIGVGTRAAPAASREPTPIRDPVPGTSALRRFHSRHGWNWLEGAQGEYLTGTSLQRSLSDGVVILNDRRVPGCAANIDHLVVAPTGVWVLDSKNWSGRIHYGTRRLGYTERLWVDGEDRTYELTKLFSYVIPVANVVANPSVPIRPVAVVLADECSLRNGLRFRLGGVYRHKGVMICPTWLVARRINGRGPLTEAQVDELGRRLSEALPARHADSDDDGREDAHVRSRSSPPRQGELWTREEERQLREEHGSGMTIAEIATLHGRSRGGIRSRLVRLGLVSEDLSSAASDR